MLCHMGQSRRWYFRTAVFVDNVLSVLLKLLLDVQDVVRVAQRLAQIARLRRILCLHGSGGGSDHFLDRG